MNEQQETDEDEDDVNEDVSLRTLAGLSSDGNTSGDDETGDVCETAGNLSRGAQAKAMSSSNRLIVAPHQKRKVVRSQTQALSELSNTLKLMAESQAKRHKKGLEADKKRDEALMAFKREEAQKNREHEIKIAEIYAQIVTTTDISSSHPTYLFIFTNTILQNARLCKCTGNPFAEPRYS